MSTLSQVLTTWNAQYSGLHASSVLLISAVSEEAEECSLCFSPFRTAANIHLDDFVTSSLAVQKLICLTIFT